MNKTDTILSWGDPHKMSARDIAAKTGWSFDTSRLALNRAVAKLAKGVKGTKLQLVMGMGDLDKLTPAQVRKQTGWSYGGARSALRRARAASKAPNQAKLAATPVLATTLTSSTYKQDQAEERTSYWKKQYQELEKKYRKAVSENALVETLVEQITSLAPTSYNAAPKATTPPAKKLQRPESAVIMLSDTHVGKVVHPNQTLGFGQYNFPTFLNRLKFLEDRVISTLVEHSTSPLQEIVVAMLGDMLDGALKHGSEAAQVNTLFAQYYGAGHAIAQFLRNIAAYAPKLRVYTVVGNHARMSDQHKMPTENRFSNFDMFLYSYIQALTRDIKHITWNLDTQPYAVFDVQGFVFHASHGDHWKGSGDRALGIPSHAIARQINSTTQLFYKHGELVPNYYLAGHLHRGMELPHGLGEVIINGGFPGLDNYALDGNFNPSDPIQRMFKVHPKYGISASYKMQLKFAPEYKQSYEVPDPWGQILV